MTQKYNNSVQRKYAAIKRGLEFWEEKLLILQNKCKHKDVSKEARSNSGNWDNTDHYWYNCKCPDCHKFWTEDQ